MRLPARERFPHVDDHLFEIVSKQSRAKAAEKAPKMVRRGVRRGFAIFLKKGSVDRLERADVDQLLGWSERVLTASTLDEVFVD